MDERGPGSGEGSTPQADPPRHDRLTGGSHEPCVPREVPGPATAILALGLSLTAATAGVLLVTLADLTVLEVVALGSAAGGLGLLVPGVAIARRTARTADVLARRATAPALPASGPEPAQHSLSHARATGRGLLAAGVLALLLSVAAAYRIERDSPSDRCASWSSADQVLTACTSTPD